MIANIKLGKNLNTNNTIYIKNNISINNNKFFLDTYYSLMYNLLLQFNISNNIVECQHPSVLIIFDTTYSEIHNICGQNIITIIFNDTNCYFDLLLNNNIIGIDLYFDGHYIFKTNTTISNQTTKYNINNTNIFDNIFTNNKITLYSIIHDLHILKNNVQTYCFFIHNLKLSSSILLLSFDNHLYEYTKNISIDPVVDIDYTTVLCIGYINNIYCIKQDIVLQLEMNKMNKYYKIPIIFKYIALLNNNFNYNINNRINNLLKTNKIMMLKGFTNIFDFYSQMFDIMLLYIDEISIYNSFECSNSLSFVLSNYFKPFVLYIYNINNQKQLLKQQKQILTNFIDFLIKINNYVISPPFKYIKTVDYNLSCEQYISIISNTNWHDELNSHSIIGLLLNIQSPKLAKLGVTMKDIVIHDISSNFISFEQLCLSHEIYFKNNNIYDTGRIKLKNAIFGTGVGNGNAIIPLYINKHHWNYVKLLINNILGFAINQNPFLYNCKSLDIYPISLVYFTNKLLTTNVITEKSIISFIQLAITNCIIFKQFFQFKINNTSIDKLSHSYISLNINKIIGLLLITTDTSFLTQILLFEPMLLSLPNSNLISLWLSFKQFLLNSNVISLLNSIIDNEYGVISETTLSFFKDTFKQMHIEYVKKNLL